MAGGLHHSRLPMDATRLYEHRWQAFYKTYLKPGTMSPLGQIQRVWWRHEDQSRGSLHIHLAVWVEPGTENDDAIEGTAPRECKTASERQWRRFVQKVTVLNASPSPPRACVHSTPRACTHSTPHTCAHSTPRMCAPSTPRVCVHSTPCVCVNAPLHACALAQSTLRACARSTPAGARSPSPSPHEHAHTPLRTHVHTPLHVHAHTRSVNAPLHACALAHSTPQVQRHDCRSGKCYGKHEH